MAKAGHIQVFAAHNGVSNELGEKTGSVKNQLFGDGVASFGQDLNGDGENDWAVAQPGSKTAAQVQWYSGLNTQAFAERAVSAPFKRQAIRLASGADVNADGVNDLAIGLPQATVEQVQTNNKVKKLKQAGGVIFISGDRF